MDPNDAGQKVGGHWMDQIHPHDPSQPKGPQPTLLPIKQ